MNEYSSSFGVLAQADGSVVAHARIARPAQLLEPVGASDQSG